MRGRVSIRITHTPLLPSAVCACVCTCHPVLCTKPSPCVDSQVTNLITNWSRRVGRVSQCNPLRPPSVVATSLFAITRSHHGLPRCAFCALGSGAARVAHRMQSWRHHIRAKWYVAMCGARIVCVCVCVSKGKGDMCVYAPAILSAVNVLYTFWLASMTSEYIITYAAPPFFCIPP